MPDNNVTPPPPPGFQLVSPTAAPPAPPPGFDIYDSYGAPGMLGLRRDTRAPVIRGVSQGLSGYNESLGDVLGAPVDLTTWLANRIPQIANLIGGEGTMGRIEDPIGGSDWWNGLQKGIGTVGADPTDDFERAARNFGRVGGGVVNSAIPLAAAARLTQAAGPAAGVLRGVFDTMVNGYRTAPGAAAVSDVAAGVGAGVGSNVAQAVAPDNSLADFFGTLIGGLTPGGINAAARGAVRGLFGGTGNAAADAAERLAAHDRLGLPPTAAAVGGQPQGTGMQNAAQMIPIPFNPVQRVQDRVYRGTEDALARLIQGTGGEAQGDAASIGEMMRNIAQQGIARRQQEFAGREGALAAQVGNAPVPTDAAEQQIARLMNRAGPEGRAALQRVQADLDSVRNATPEQLAGMQDTLARLQALAQDPALAPIVQPDIDRLTQEIATGRGVPYPVMDNTRKEIGARSAREGIPAQYMDPIYGGIREGQEQALGAVDPALPGTFNRLKADEQRFLSADVPRSEGGDAVTLSRAQREDVNATSLANTEFNQVLKDPARLATYWRNATPQQRANLQATIIDNLGKATAGQQRAGGDAFSFNTFMKNYNSAAMPNEVKAIAFGEDTPMRRVLDDIATIAESQRNLKQTENRSQTGRVAINQGIVGSMMGVGALTDILSTGLASGVAYGGTSAIVARKLAEWVATQPPEIQQRVLTKALGLGIAGSPEDDKEDPTIRAIRGQ